MHLRILFIFSVLAIWILSVGYNNGPAQIAGIDRTGSPLSGGAFCGECHNTGGNYNPEMIINVFDKNDQLATKYIPGETYTLRVDYDFEGTPAGYGMQAVALDLGQNNAGTFRGGSQRTQIVKVSDITFFEHEKLVSILPFEVDWVAPPAGTGEVIMYAGGIVANGNRGNAGDNAVLGKVDLPEDTGSSTNELDGNNFNFQVLTNPTTGLLKIAFKEQEAGDYHFQLTDISGKVIKQQLEKISNNQIFEIDISAFNNGIYFLKVNNDKSSFTQKVLKI